MPEYGLGITVQGQDFDVRMSLDYYPLNASFVYGAQPPDIYPDWIDLVPSTDKDSNELGPSLFAWAFYNKLVIRKCRQCCMNSTLTKVFSTRR